MRGRFSYFGRLATEEQRLAYLESLGWAVDADPVETLDLRLPEQLENEWKDYAQLQSHQDLPFAAFAGQSVRRYTYTVTNYPGIEKGVQINLYVYDQQLIEHGNIEVAVDHQRQCAGDRGSTHD